MQSGPHRLRAAARDEVRDGLCLREVELVVEEGSLGEFPGFCTACAERHGGLDERREHPWPAVRVQFEHVLARERRRRCEVQRDAGIQLRAGRITEARQGRLARPGYVAQHSLRDARGLVARDAHDADSADPGWSGDRDDGVHVAVRGD